MHEFKIRVFYQIFQRQDSRLLKKGVGMISVTCFTDNADGFFLLQLKSVQIRWVGTSIDIYAVV